MKTAVLYYSYTGKTRALAEKRAGEEGAELIEVRERKPRSTLGAYVMGSLAARRRKKAEILPVSRDLSAFDRFLILIPLWAGFPAPPFNNMLDLLPKGSEVELVITSGSENSGGSKEKTIALAAAKDIKIVKYQDVKTA